MVKCPECGSTDVTKIGKNEYECNMCESVFSTKKDQPSKKKRFMEKIAPRIGLRNPGRIYPPFKDEADNVSIDNFVKVLTWVARIFIPYMLLVFMLQGLAIDFAYVESTDPFLYAGYALMTGFKSTLFILPFAGPFVFFFIDLFSWNAIVLNYFTLTNSTGLAMLYWITTIPMVLVGAYLTFACIYTIFEIGYDGIANWVRRR